MNVVALVFTLAAAAPAPLRTPRAPLLTDVAALGVGDRHACVAKRDGTVACWGDGANYQAGLVAGRPIRPTDGVVPLVGIDDATGVSAGFTATCFTRRSGEVSCVGGRYSMVVFEGQPPVSSPTPVPVVTYPASRWARAVVVGGDRIAVLSAAGEVDFFRPPFGTPIPAAGLADAVQIAVGWDNVCARMPGGGVRCFGPNYGGENGNGGDGEDIEPVEVRTPRVPTPEILADSYETCGSRGCEPALTGAVDLDVHGRMACVAMADGRVACWGGGADHAPLHLGKLGFARSPLYVPGVTDAVEVSVGYDFVCARRRAGTIMCWGMNDHGQLGAPGPARAEPREVPGIAGAVAIEVGDAYACALDAAGAVRCWGEVAPTKN